ncbi:hypothetical protein CSUI_005925 [Cystoisospora suis]|uniref:Uncharacterized protein n=1 Tax=Cystoisospora suis TaxID=483139 RepID=A0A2C6KVU0_9APIC|nr:hypothetical protein CSUI_005925 [Cystoisospora suis]
MEVAAVAFLALGGAVGAAAVDAVAGLRARAGETDDEQSDMEEAEAAEGRSHSPRRLNHLSSSQSGSQPPPRGTSQNDPSTPDVPVYSSNLRSESHGERERGGGLDRGLVPSRPASATAPRSFGSSGGNSDPGEPPTGTTGSAGSPCIDTGSLNTRVPSRASTHRLWCSVGFLRFYRRVEEVSREHSRAIVRPSFLPARRSSVTVLGTTRPAHIPHASSNESVEAYSELNIPCSLAGEAGGDETVTGIRSKGGDRRQSPNKGNRTWFFSTFSSILTPLGLSCESRRKTPPSAAALPVVRHTTPAPPPPGQQGDLPRGQSAGTASSWRRVDSLLSRHSPDRGSPVHRQTTTREAERSGSADETESCMPRNRVHAHCCSVSGRRSVKEVANCLPCGVTGRTAHPPGQDRSSSAAADPAETAAHSTASVATSSGSTTASEEQAGERRGESVTHGIAEPASRIPPPRFPPHDNGLEPAEIIVELPPQKRRRMMKEEDIAAPCKLPISGDREGGTGAANSVQIKGPPLVQLRAQTSSPDSLVEDSAGELAVRSIAPVVLYEESQSVSHASSHSSQAKMSSADIRRTSSCSTRTSTISSEADSTGGSGGRQSSAILPLSAAKRRRDNSDHSKSALEMREKRLLRVNASSGSSASQPGSAPNLTYGSMLGRPTFSGMGRASEEGETSLATKAKIQLLGRKVLPPWPENRGSPDTALHGDAARSVEDQKPVNGEMDRRRTMERTNHATKRSEECRSAPAEQEDGARQNRGRTGDSGERHNGVLEDDDDDATLPDVSAESGSEAAHVVTQNPDTVKRPVEERVEYLSDPDKGTKRLQEKRTESEAPSRECLEHDILQAVGDVCWTGGAAEGQPLAQLHSEQAEGGKTGVKRKGESSSRTHGSRFTLSPRKKQEKKRTSAASHRAAAWCSPGKARRLTSMATGVRNSFPQEETAKSPSRKTQRMSSVERPRGGTSEEVEARSSNGHSRGVPCIPPQHGNDEFLPGGSGKPICEKPTSPEDQETVTPRK